MRRIITLLTDFGTADGFVGAMKGVILARAPDAQVVDLTHEIPPQSIHHGAWALREAAGMFPANTVHVAVVDPGVGTARRPVLIAENEQLFVGPDNGVLTLAATGGRAWHLDRREVFRNVVSNTFHGRDVFASVAGHLAAGTAPDRCGSPIASWCKLHEPRPARRGHGVEGQVVHTDRFGNLITNIDRQWLESERAWEVRVEALLVGPLRSTFGDVEPGQWVAYMGSSGRVEVAVRDGSAAEAARARGLPEGARVTLCRV